MAERKGNGRMAERKGNGRMARAAVYDAPNKPFEVRMFPVRDVKRGEVLVRVKMSTICRSDIHSYCGHRPSPCPGILGHEIIGTIEQIGGDVGADLRGDALAVGDRITWTEYFHSGESYYRDIHDMPQKAEGVRKYGHDLATEDPHFLGGFAEYCYIQPGTGILKLPDSITDEEATPLNCGAATMVAVVEAAGLKEGGTVVVQGLGLLGLYGCAISKAGGASRVIGLDSVADRLDMAVKFGADHAVDISGMAADDQVAMIRDLCPPDGADAVLEVCGVPSAIPTGLRMLRIGGTYVIGGLVNPGAEFSVDGNFLLRRWATIRGVHNYHPRHLVEALDFVMDNRDRFPFSEIVDSRFTLDQLNDAFKKAGKRSVLRAAIVP